MSRVADDLYLIAHDDRSGRCRVSRRVAGLGLAAAVLADLVLSGLVTVHDGELYPVSVAQSTRGPGDRLGGAVLELVRDSRQARDLGVWLTFLAGEAVSDVRQRLVEDGVLVPLAVRRLGVRRMVHRPADPNQAIWPSVRLAGLLSRQDVVGLADAALICLVAATGLLRHVLWLPDEHGPGWAHARAIRRGLPSPLGQLVARAESSTGARVLTRRPR